MRVIAIAWLCAAAPLELASALAALIGRPTSVGATGSVLILARVAVVAGGLVLGRGLLQRTPGLRRPAVLWAVADLGTLALVLATRVLPSNRAPGDGLIVWAAYAAAAVIVVLAARDPRALPELSC